MSLSRRLAERPAYKWVVLVAACLTQTFCAGYTNSAISFFSVFYAERFGDRKTAGVIGPVMGGLLCMSALPALMLTRRLGDRFVHLVGGVMLLGGQTLTAFSTRGWQGILGTGVLGGLGAAMCLSAPFSILSKYFPGNQILPYAAMSACYTVGIIISPQFAGALMPHLGYTNTLVACGSFLLVNLLAGLAFCPREISAEAQTNDVPPEPKYSIKLTGKRSGILHITLPHSHVTTAVTFDPQQLSVPALYSADPIDDKQRENDSQQSLQPTLVVLAPPPKLGPDKLIGRQQSYLSRFLDNLQTAIPEADDHTVNTKVKAIRESPNTTYKMAVLRLHGAGIAALLDTSRLDSQSLLKLLKHPQAFIYILSSFCLQSSFFAFSAVLGDYCTRTLHMTESQFGLGLTITGVAMLPANIAYLVMGKAATFSASFLHTVNTALIGTLMTLMVLQPEPEKFYLIMALYGVGRAIYISNLLPICMELTSPERGMMLYTTSLIAEGAGGISAMYLAVYLQVEVDYRLGMAFSGGLMLLSALILFPVGVRNLARPQDYNRKCESLREAIEQTSHQPGGDYKLSDP